MSESESEGEIEVIEVKAANSLVPNLTISVEKDDEEPTVEFQEEKTEVFRDEDVELDDAGVEIKVSAQGFLHTKIYENKLLKDVGVTAEEARLKKQSRVKRFQSPLLRDEEQPNNLDQKPIENLIQKVKNYNEKHGIFQEIRLDAVHLRGLDDMSTDDIFKFFSDHYPSHIEWIDDTSCNVVWKDETSAASAVLDMSKPMAKKTAKLSEAPTQKMEDFSAQELNDDELDLMESGDEEEKMDVEEGEIPLPKDSDEKPFDNELRRCKHPAIKNGKKTLLKIRFANVNDKKTLGGANKSRYYRKYGNPNYGNTKGVLSRSFKKRFHGRVAKQEFEEYKPESSEQTVKTRVPTKRLYSEPAWTEAKRARKESESSAEEENQTEREDQELINSSARDLEGAIPVPESKNGKVSYDSMEADNITRNDIAKKKPQDASSMSGTLTVKVKGKGSVWDRLGSKSVGRAMQQDSAKPKSLKDRLGTRR